MNGSRSKIDRFFLYSTIGLSAGGFVVFLSASLGLLTQSNAIFNSVTRNQAAGLLIGAVLFWALSRVKYTFWKKLALPILILAVGLNLLLFIPALTLHYNGASRWINLGFTTLQPSEFLKIAFIIYLAAWIGFAKDRIKSMRYGLLPYVVLMAILGTLLLIQSDTDTLIIIGVTGMVMLWVAGTPIRHLVLLGVLLAVVVGGVIMMRPYAMERFKVYLNPTGNSQGSSYQINQSLIAIGSGSWTGRGFGQSIQKFGYLPQPTDDSIFAVAAEEFGFVGGVILIALYCSFIGSAFRVGTRAVDPFGAMIAVGIAALVAAESFLNIAAMLGLMPVSGVPLLFVSHGGTALIIILMTAGLVANISKYRK